MKQPIYIFSLLVLMISFADQTEYIDPTGTYKLVAKTQKRNGETYGYFGQIQVKKIGTEKIVMSFDVNKGAPSYNSGSFVDTLNYSNNSAIYTDPESDETCKITFVFSKRSIVVKEETANYNMGCGFGHAVIADGLYKKKSKKIPVIIN